ncbi:MAG: DUF1249 domain-containing protein [SAR86 cluster bacterium]|jgi:uncharacterized protein YqiB (DUF1249 family)|nr:MAG: DUF1249 domain-containing protein [SAR86 cluster bacterium]URQ69458.1 DUF1249 domain-containing protein [SAR86 cluster bacterium]|tara:strand:- start:28 stop:471 length:444 start_codon:yes stop_codon:yes gene_type:complete
MLKTLPITSHFLALCTKNYIKLEKLLLKFKKNKYKFEILSSDDKNLDIDFLILNKTKHTILLEAKQKEGFIKNKILILRIQISLDAKLAEVISYQGEKPIPFFLNQTKIQSPDEKIQQNIFLTEWLENIFSSGMSDINKIKNILKSG